MKDKSDISLSFRFLKECSLSENVLILYFLKKESNINRTFNLPNLYLLSDIKVKEYTALGLTTYSAPNVPSSALGAIYRFDEPAGPSGPFVMFNQNVQNQGIGLTSDVNSTGLAYEKTTFQSPFCIRY